jgi:cysteine desulfurase
MSRRIYLDHAATTPLAPEAREAMLPWLSTEHGNPSSIHAEGRHAKDALDEAREVLSQTLGCLFAEVQFTSSGTEAANAAILGWAMANLSGPRRTVLISAAEHHCVLHTRVALEKLGFQVRLIPVDREAGVSVEAVRALLSDQVGLVSVMHANNETGIINPVAEIAAAVHEVGAVMHCDAVQTFLSVPWTLDSLGADLISITAHKVYGPKGVGALVVRAGLELFPLIHGGGQEREQRGGTENVAGIVGFGAAVRTWQATGNARQARDHFRQELDALGHRHVWTVRPDAPCLPGHAHLRLPGIPAESMLIVLDREGLSVSSGAACSSGSLEPSHVLRATGLSEAEANEGIRVTFGRHSTLDEATFAAKTIAAVSDKIGGQRNLS